MFDLIRALLNEHHAHHERRHNEILKELKTMSDTVDTRLAGLTTLIEKERDDNAKFRGDVTAALAALGGAGTMTDAQKAAFDNLTVIVTATDAATVEADAALTTVTPAA